jgi:hypothetical protein
MCALGGDAIDVDGGTTEFTGETGTELTRTTSSWKSVTCFVLWALSILSIAGSGVGVFVRCLLLGLVCLGARGGGGNSCSAGPAMSDATPVDW